MSSFIHGWKEGQLRDLCEIHYGKSPNEVRVDYSEYAIWGTGGQSGFAKSSLFKGPYTLVGRKGTISKPIWIQNDSWVIDTAYAVQAKKNVEEKFLYYLLDISDLKELNESTGVPSLNRETLYNFKVSYPESLLEQKKIAEILTSVDKVIELTEIEIEKLKNLKKGMIQDLLTKGIGHTKFKDCPIGKIPESWDVKYIGDLCRVGTGSRDTQDKVKGGKYPFYVRSAQVERIDTYSFDGVAILTVGDGVGTGKVFHYTEGKIEIHQRVYKLSEFDKSIHPKFLYYYFSENFLYRVEKFSAKTSVDSVRMEMITKMHIPLPSIEEQIKVAEACQSIEKTIEFKEHKLEKTKNMKKGLMQDLLTGKVRVKV